MSEERFAKALREGLKEIPVPPATRDFDARVLAAVSEPQAGWREILKGFRPALGGVALAVPLMFWLIHVSQSSGTTQSYSQVQESAVGTVSETALDSPMLTPLSLRRAAKHLDPAPAKPEDAPDQAGAPDSTAFNS